MKNITTDTKSGRLKTTESLSDITRSEWMKALGDAWVSSSEAELNPEALSKRELGELMGISSESKRFCGTLNRLIEAGDVKVVKKRKLRNDGHRCAVTAYLLTDQCKKKLKVR